MTLFNIGLIIKFILSLTKLISPLPTNFNLSELKAIPLSNKVLVQLECSP